MTPPEPSPKNEITAEGVVNTSGPGGATEDLPDAADLGLKGLAPDTKTGQTTSGPRHRPDLRRLRAMR